MPFRTVCPLALLLAALSGHAQAETPQSFSAQVGDIAFESGDDEITLVPVMGSFSLSASTRGAAAYPPPTTRIDRLSIVCDGFEDGKPILRDHRAFERGTCNVTFEKGSKPMGGSPVAEYTLDKNSPENRFEITAAQGKVYKGTFTFRLKDDKGGTITVSNGRFTAEDRQI